MEEQNDRVVIASFFERIVAFIIDIFFLNLILFLPAFIAVKINLITSENSLKIFNYFAYALMFLYFVIFNKTGKTIGKMLVGIAVINKDEENSLTLKQSILRTLGYILELFTLGGGLLLGLVNKKHKTLHDFMGSSIVIRTRKKSQAEEIAFTVVGTVVIVSFLLFLYYMFFKAPSPFDSKKIALAKEQLENLAYLEEIHKQNFGYYTDDLRRLSLISGDGVQLNRDLQRAFKRNHFFKIGLNKDKTSYRIEGHAKDSKETLVFKEKL